jgi:hypothetical protein
MEKKPEYQISTSVNEGIFEFILTGEVTSSTTENLQKEIIAFITVRGAEKLLMDVRACKGSFEYAEAYNRVRKYPPYLFRIKVAIVDVPDRKDFKSFYETTAINVGLRFKWFYDIDAARAWLKIM